MLVVLNGYMIVIEILVEFGVNLNVVNDLIKLFLKLLYFVKRLKYKDIWMKLFLRDCKLKVKFF